MKAPDFGYERPETLADAIALLSDDTRDVVPLAGGQSLMPMMNFRMARPDVVVDLAAISTLRGVRETDAALIFGAMTRYRDIMSAQNIARDIPLFAHALPHVAHAAIRNRGTIGGSAALADPAAEMPALLLALGADITVQGPKGTRRVAADDFFLGLYETALEPGELIVEIEVPKATSDDRYGFYELARRHGDYAMAGVAVAARVGVPLRVAYFGVSDSAVRATGAEAALANGLDDAAIDAAIATLDEIDFAEDLNGDAATKRHLAGVVLRRAVREMR